MTERDRVPLAAPADVPELDLEDLYEHAPCGYLSTLPDGRIIRVNETFLRWTGYAREELVAAKRFDELLTPGGRIYYETHYAPLLRMQGRVREIAFEIVGADGRQFPALVNSVMKRDAEGNPALVRTMIFDATERRAYERELVRARERAEASDARARALAQTLQASFIPPEPPRIPDLDVAALYRPAGTGDEVGGDFFDVFETAHGDWAIVVGDVCGKGVEAARVTALVRYTLRATAMRTRNPRAVLATLNEAMFKQRVDRFVTVVYARLQTAPRGRIRLSVASGGHPLPLRVTAAGSASAVGRPGMLLGIFADPQLHDGSVELEPGDVVAFYTDGLTEGRSAREFFGEERMRDILMARRDADASTIAQTVVGEVVRFQAGMPRDDIALIVLKVPLR